MQISATTPRPLAGKRIIVDAGHGGTDVGAIGPSGVREAQVTLAVARRLKEELNALGAEVRMPRNSDTFISLKQRVATANAWPAQLFVSVHCNSAGSAAAHGTETFYHRTGDGSSRMAASVLRDFSQATKLDSRGVKNANFYVIKHTKMPAVLHELAFVSNPKEEKLLASADFQAKAAKAIANGIRSFVASKELHRVS